MAKQKANGITWATHTFNHIRGCTKVSEGCANCYAETLSGRNPATLGIWGPNGTRVLASDAMWKEPLKWNREAEGAKERPRVFCASLSDVFEEWDGPILDSQGRRMLLSYGDGGKRIAYEYQGHGPKELDWTDLTMHDVRRRLFDLFDLTPNVNWLVLTKRPQNIRKYWFPKRHYSDQYPDDPYPNADKVTGRAGPAFYRHNVWIGTTVENQIRADERIPELLKCRDLSPVLWLSCEPLLGPIDLNKWLFVGPEGGFEYEGSPRNWLSWCIVGGESGNHARPMQPDWARSIRDQCQAAGVAMHFKQWGEFGPAETATPVQQNNAVYHVCERGERVYRVGKNAAGRMLDGREWNEFPNPANR